MPPILNQRCHWDLGLVGCRNIAARIRATCVKAYRERLRRRRAVRCSRSVSLPTALWFIIKPSPTGMEGGMGLPSPRRWDNSGHLCSEALQTAQTEVHPHCLRYEASRFAPDSHSSFLQSKVNLNMFSEEFGPAILIDEPLDPSGLLKEAGPVASSQDLASKHSLRQCICVFVFDKVTNVFAIKGSVSTRFVTPYHLAPLHTTSWQTR